MPCHTLQPCNAKPCTHEGVLLESMPYIKLYSGYSAQPDMSICPDIQAYRPASQDKGWRLCKVAHKLLFSACKSFKDRSEASCATDCMGGEGAAYM